MNEYLRTRETFYLEKKGPKIGAPTVIRTREPICDASQYATEKNNDNINEAVTLYKLN